MKKILIITYYWPPSGGAAVQRWLSFANNLADKNIEVHLLTVSPEYATYQLHDESLREQVHPSIKVYTTKTREPFKLFTLLFGKKSIPKPAFANEDDSSFLKKVSRFIRGNFFIPDPRKGWRPYAVKEAIKIISTEKISCVITAGPPHSTHFIGKDLREKLNIYWIADFHDLWTDIIYYDMLYHLPFVKKIDQELEKTILESCDEIVTVGDKYKEKLLSKTSKISADKIKILRIGYDEKLFKEDRLSSLQNQFVITYTGTIADFYDPQVFIDALAKVIQQFPKVAFRLRFAGVLSSGIRAKVIEAGLATIFEDMGYVSHKEVIQLLQTSTIVLLVNPVTKDEAMVIPGKIYEYLASGKPIINITTSDAETAGIIAGCAGGKTFNRGETIKLENYLAELVQKWSLTSNLDNRTNLAAVSQFSRQAITEKFIKMVDDHL